jgi:hypothetical protein
MYKEVDSKKSVVLKTPYSKEAKEAKEAKSSVGIASWEDSIDRREPNDVGPCPVAPDKPRTTSQR